MAQTEAPRGFTKLWEEALEPEARAAHAGQRTGDTGSGQLVDQRCYTRVSVRYRSTGLFRIRLNAALADQERVAPLNERELDIQGAEAGNQQAVLLLGLASSRRADSSCRFGLFFGQGEIQPTTIVTDGANRLVDFCVQSGSRLEYSRQLIRSVIAALCVGETQ